MNINEIRLGNFIAHNVKNEDGDFLAPNEDAVTEDDLFHFLSEGSNVEEATPIELNAFWLKCFGWRRYRRADIPTWTRKGSPIGWLIRMDFESKFYVVLGKKIILTNVHQLQNLYFAIEGEELTFKSISHGRPT